MTRLHEKGCIDDGAYLEFLHSHTSVAMQPELRRPPLLRASTPTRCGFAMMQDIERDVARRRRTEDRARAAGHRRQNGDPYGTLREVWANFRDVIERCRSSPHLILEVGLFDITDDHDEDEMEVSAIHDERGYL